VFTKREPPQRFADCCAMEMFAAPNVELLTRPDGALLLRSRDPLLRYASNTGAVLDRWAQERPGHVFLAERNGEEWVSRKVASNGVVCVGHQHVSVGKHYGGSACDVLVTDGLLQFWVGSELLKTAARTSSGEIRKKHAEGGRRGDRVTGGVADQPK